MADMSSYQGLRCFYCGKKVSESMLICSYESTDANTRKDDFVRDGYSALCKACVDKAGSCASYKILKKAKDDPMSDMISYQGLKCFYCGKKVAGSMLICSYESTDANTRKDDFVRDGYSALCTACADKAGSCDSYKKILKKAKDDPLVAQQSSRIKQLLDENDTLSKKVLQLEANSVAKEKEFTEKMEALQNANQGFKAASTGVPGVKDFVDHLGLQARDVGELAAEWIVSQEGTALVDVPTFGMVKEFLDALDLKRISRAKAEKYLAELASVSLASGPAVFEEARSTASEHALAVLGLGWADLPWTPFAPELQMAEAAVGSAFRVAAEDLFDDAGVNCKYKVTRVRAFRNLTLQQAFDANFEKLRIRRANKDTPFHRNFLFSTSKGRLLRRLQRRFGPKVPNVGGANWIPVWHGTMCETAEAVCKTGFAALSKLDDGFFCRGIYNTPDAQYACRYGMGEFGLAAGSPGSAAVLLSLLCVGLAYPVDRDTDYAPGAPETANSLLMGQPLKASEGYDCHVAAVEEPYFQAAADPAKAQYLELVVEQESALFPLAILEYIP